MSCVSLEPINDAHNPHHYKLVQAATEVIMHVFS